MAAERAGSKKSFMFRMGRGSCDGCEGRRPWRFLGHTRGATVLIVAAVAACTLPSTATDTVDHLHTSTSRHVFCSLTCSCLLPSEYLTSPAAPGLPVLEVERQHRISKPVRAATSSPEQRVVIHATLSSPVPLSCQHVNHNGQGRAPCRNSDIGSSAAFLLLCRQMNSCRPSPLALDERWIK